MFRYIGNKTRLLPKIEEKVQSMIGRTGTIADIMAGTGLVSAHFKKLGYKMISSDMMTYSKHHLNTELLLNKAPNFQRIYSINLGQSNRYENLLSYLNNLDPEEGYFFKEFSPEGEPANGSNPRMYFTSENACKIDAIRSEINRLIDSKEISDLEESLLKHTLIMSVNDVANISGTYGHYLSKFNKSSCKAIELCPHIFENIDYRTDHTVLQGFAEDLAPNITADICYIDPPYMKRQYAANYHILETIAQGDYPEARGQSGLRDWWPQHSKLCTKTRSKNSFEKIISSMNCNKFLISYSEDGLLSIDQLTNIFEQFGNVVVNSVEYERFRSNQSKLPKNINEYLIEIYKE